MRLNVNFGCDKVPIHGWINYDNSPSVIMARFPFLKFVFKYFSNNDQIDFIDICLNNNIRYLNFSKRIPLGDNDVENIYTCFSIDYLEKKS